jgi:hypothetical protein
VGAAELAFLDNLARILDLKSAIVAIPPHRGTHFPRRRGERLPLLLLLLLLCLLKDSESVEGKQRVQRRGKQLNPAGERMMRKGQEAARSNAKGACRRGVNGRI